MNQSGGVMVPIEQFNGNVFPYTMAFGVQSEEGRDGRYTHIIIGKFEFNKMCVNMKKKKKKNFFFKPFQKILKGKKIKITPNLKEFAI